MVPFFPRKLNDRKRPRPLLTPRPTCKRRSHLKAGTNGHAILIPLVSDHLTMKIVLVLLFSILAASFGVPLPGDAEEDGEQMREGREAEARRHHHHHHGHHHHGHQHHHRNPGLAFAEGFIAGAIAEEVIAEEVFLLDSLLF